MLALLSLTPIRHRLNGIMTSCHKLIRQRAPSLSARTALHAGARSEVARETSKAQRERCLLVA